jgi:hypothetical protein
VNDKPNRSVRLRYTAMGALAALAAVGAVAGTAALAAKPHASAPHRVAVANRARTKSPTAGAPDKTGAPQPSPSPQPFLDDVQRLVDNGTITAAESQVVDREIVAGRIDTDSLTAAGFTDAQLQAVNQALGDTKRGRAAAAHSGSR